MAHYTTQVRSYLETLYGLEASADYPNVEKIIAGTYAKVFTKSVPFYNASQLDRLKQAVLYHYYMREIGVETVGLWKYEMNKTLSEIADYYSKLYESAELQFNPLYDVDYTREGERVDNVAGQTDRKENREDTADRTDTAHNVTASERDASGNVTEKTDGSTTSKDRYSDTPQNGLSAVDNNQYLTNYEAVDTTNDQETNRDTTEHETGKETTDTSTVSHSLDVGHTTGQEERSEKSDGSWSERIHGKQGNASYAKMIEELRNTFLRLDQQFIAEFEDCFLLLV